MTNKTDKNQNENQTYLERVTEEFQENGRLDIADRVESLWDQKLRVPQDVCSPLDTIHS